MECHKCEHRAAVEAGKFLSVAFADTPCARCDGTSPESYTLPFCELKGTDDAMSPELSVPEQAFPVADPPDPTFPIGVLANVLAVILALPDMELRILRLRRRGFSYEAIAKALGSTTSRAVECRFKRLLDRFPVLLPLFPDFRGVICNLPGK